MTTHTCIVCGLEFGSDNLIFYGTNPEELDIVCWDCSDWYESEIEPIFNNPLVTDASESEPGFPYLGFDPIDIYGKPPTKGGGQ